MPSAAVEAAFRTRLGANWVGTILGVNAKAPPDDGSAFALIHYPVSDNSRQTLTRRRFEDGAARIIYNVPSGTPLETCLPVADAIAAVFRGDRLKDGHVEYFEPSAPIINDENDDGNYFELAVIVPYRYQFDAA